MRRRAQSKSIQGNRYLKEVLEGFEAGPTAGLNALKNRWLGRVAARVALERPAGGFEAFEGFEAGQTARLNALKNRI